MSPEEVAFRLLKVNTLCGDEMLHALCVLRQQADITLQTLAKLGFSVKQAQRFFRSPLLNERLPSGGWHYQTAPFCWRIRRFILNH